MTAATQQHVRDAIRSTGATGTAAEVLAIITAQSIEKTDSTPVTASTLETRIDPQMAIAMIEKFGAVKGSSARLEAQFYQFATVGLDMSAQPRRDAIDQLVLAGVFTADEGAALKGIGRWQVSPLEEIAGRGTTTDEATVQQVLDHLAAAAAAESQRQAQAAEEAARRAMIAERHAEIARRWNLAYAVVEAGGTVEDAIAVFGAA